MAVLLPFAVQLVHSFEHHAHTCSSSDLHIDTHEFDCEVFHFQIEQNYADFSSNFTIVDIAINEEKIFAAEDQIASAKNYYKSSRAPPYLLL